MTCIYVGRIPAHSGVEALKVVYAACASVNRAEGGADVGKNRVPAHAKLRRLVHLGTPRVVAALYLRRRSRLTQVTRLSEKSWS